MANGRARILIGACLGLAWMACGIAVADESPTGWTPPPPMPDESTWIQLTSGEWLRGEVIALYSGVLEFDSDKLDEQLIDWEDIQQMRSHVAMEVSFDDGSITLGMILIENGTIRVMGIDPREVAVDEVVSMLPGTPREIDNWSVKASLGSTARRGNNDQLEVSTRATVSRRTTRNRINLDYLASFNRTEGVIASDNQRLTFGWNHYPSRDLFWTPVSAEWFRDPFQNIASQWTVGSGLGYDIIDTPKVSWDIGAGIAYQATRFGEVVEGEDRTVDTPALTLGTIYDNELTSWMDFAFEWRARIVNEDSGRYNHHLVTGFEFELTKRLDVDITFVWDRIENPQEDASGLQPDQDDFRLLTTLGFDF
jgi:putative salt-induced outer membrane protein YdiY